MAGIPETVTLLAGTAVEAVLNGLWQGMALAGLIWLLLRSVPRHPGMRYAAWYACLVATFLLPAAHVAARLWPVPPAADESVEAPHAAAGPGPGLRSPAVGTAAIERPRTVSLPASASTVLIPMWAVAALLLGTRLARSYRNIARLKKNAQPLDDPDTGRWASSVAPRYTRRRFDVRSSEEVRLPMLAGLARPAILFPRELVPRLSAEERFRICLHELAHIRRRDDWANLVQRIIEAILFFHPAVRWIGKRIRFERELACDDWVVAVSGAARPYAACLVRLAELATSGSDPLPALGSAGDRKLIERRIEMILNPERSRRSVWSRVVFFAVLLACLAASAVAARMGPVITVEDPPAAVGPPPAPEAPPAPPAPPAQASKPAPPAEPQIPEAPAGEGRQAEPAREAAERMRAQEEEIRKFSEEIRKEVENGIRAKTEEIRKLADQIGEKVRMSIQPQVREISELAAKLAQEQIAAQPNEELVRKLKEEIRRREDEIGRVSKQEIEGLEKQIRALEEAIRPSEEQIRKLEARIRGIEREMRDKEREIEREIRVKPRESRPQRDRSVPPPPPPPAPPQPPPPQPPK